MVCEEMLLAVHIITYRLCAPPMHRASQQQRDFPQSVTRMCEIKALLEFHALLRIQFFQVLSKKKEIRDDVGLLRIVNTNKHLTEVGCCFGPEREVARSNRRWRDSGLNLKKM